LFAALSVGMLIWFGAPFLAEYWFTKSTLSEDLISKCLQWMGLQSSFQFLTGYYNSGLIGLQKIKLSNSIAASTQTLRTVVLISLLMINPQIELYFVFQAVMSFFSLIVTAYALYCILPKVDYLENPSSNQRKTSGFLSKLAKRYSHERFKACRRFAAGMAATTLATLALTQLDKVILSKMLSLEDFGYYTIAASIAAMLAKPASLVYGAALPRMTQLATNGDTATLNRIYFKSSSLVSWMVLPAAGILAGFSLPLISLYLQNAESASHIAPLASILVIGFALHSCTLIPYGLTLAYGWSKFGVYLGVFGSLIIVPLMIAATDFYGAIGAAFIWDLVCFSYVTIFMVVIHNKYLKGVLGRWYKDVMLLQALIMVLFATLGIFKI